MTTALQQEWNTLHGDIERYEKLALLIKLCAMVVFALGIGLNLHPVNTGFLLLVAWLQNGIWNTFQGRLESRITCVEAAIKHGEQSEAMQLYSQWNIERPGLVGMVTQYVKSSLRPTVAYPYVLLIVLLVVLRVTNFQ